jgi:hypothetical protein
MSFICVMHGGSYSLWYFGVEQLCFNLCLWALISYRWQHESLMFCIHVFLHVQLLYTHSHTRTHAHTCLYMKIHTHILQVDVVQGNLISICGGKWTTYRKMAEDAVDRAVESNAALKHATPCVTHDLKLIGADRGGLVCNQNFDKVLICVCVCVCVWYGWYVRLD